MTVYQIKMNGKYLQSIEPNEHYNPYASAPTMGRRHTLSEFHSVWGTEPKTFEPLTAASNIKCIFEEFRWNARKAQAIRIVPVEEE